MKKLLCIFLLLVGGYQTIKELPEGVSVLGDVHHVPASSVTLFIDKTYTDPEDGERYIQQEIYTEIFKLVRESKQYLLIDMYQFNSFGRGAPLKARELSRELTELLLEKKNTYPDMELVIITDPINTVYGGVEAVHLTELAAAGATVITTDLRPLRDSNPIYSAVWRSAIQWFGNSHKGSILGHPFDPNGRKVTMRSYFDWFNSKANHRRVIVADRSVSGSEVRLVTLVTSADAHDASTANSNLALEVADGVWRDAVITENTVAEFSGVPLETPAVIHNVVDRNGSVEVRYITEGKIRKSVVGLLDGLGKGDTIDITTLYLSDRKVVQSLKDAASRGVQLRLLLDSNTEAYGRDRVGLPNLPVANELMTNHASTTNVRWCDTHGEQCRGKMILVNTGDVRVLIVGSANLTRRSIGDYNLEANIWVEGERNIEVFKKASAYFDEMWNNEKGRNYSVDYEVHASDSLIETLAYRIIEFTGLSSF